MGKLHELLATEKTLVTAANKLLAETSEKFGKDAYFKGYVKSLKMLADSPENAELERAGSEIRALPTTVKDTLDYALDYWARTEDALYQKNVSNTEAKSAIEFRGRVVAEDVPVDELMGLEVRLEALRKILERMPTLDASKEWRPDPQKGEGVWVTATPDVTTKTEKRMVPVVLYEATKEHPAQVREVARDDIVGTFTTVHYSGAATSAQKAKALETVDELLTEVKKARVRANSVEASTARIGAAITGIILQAFN